VTSIISPGSGILYMKIGEHASEPLEEIIRRKRQEIEDAGHALWGYGGATCHPTSMVQPFARDYEKRNGVIYLCMEPMVSHHLAPTRRANQFSTDGINWDPVPEKINVLGSRYALAIDDLHQEEFELPLAQTKVALGNSMGRLGNKYIAGRVDKACLVVTDDAGPEKVEDRSRPIGWVARLVPPYAVFVRSLD
jgi:hypothetical protein